MKDQTRIVRIISGLCLSLLFSLPTLAAEPQKVSEKDLEERWSFYGDGSRKAQSRMFYMEENKGSKGVMVVSPTSFDGDVTLRYEIMPMTAASVCVAMMSATDVGKNSLTIPKDYDGSMGHWIKNVDNYFFAFHNAAHNRPPFLKRFPANEKIGTHDKNVMHAGTFYAIEISRKGDTLRFSVDGKLVYEAKDPKPLTSGHVAFRIRGISQQPASCFIRNVTIETDSK